MAWTAPRSWTTGEVVTASMLNTHVRDDLLETAPAKVTTRGDLVRATGAAALERFAVGTASQVLVGGTDPAWGPVPLAALPAGIGVSVRKSANQSIAVTTSTVLTFDLEDVDTDAMHSTVTNTSRLTVVTAGFYLFVANVQWEGNSSGERIVRILLNGATLAAAQSASVVGASDEYMSAAVIQQMAAAAFAEIQVYQSAAAPLNVRGGSGFSTSFSAIRLGA